MSEHTYGPWTADFSSDVIRVRAPDGSGICTINWLSATGRREGNEGEANARLIAAAPELLATLKHIANHEEGMEGYGVSDIAVAARAAIAKAYNG